MAKPVRLPDSCLAAVLLLSACGPAYPPPPGYTEACYGSDFENSLSGSSPTLSVRIRASEEKWADLSAHVAAFAKANQLEFFDTTLFLDHVHALGISACSSRGVFIYAGEQHWQTGPMQGKYDRERVVVRFYSYRNFAGVPLAESLFEHLKKWDADAARE